MKTSNFCALSALFGAIANAAPVNKRDIVWVTHLDIETVTVPLTSTVWVDFPSTFPAYTTPAASTTVVASSSASAAATESSTSVYVAPTTSSSSVYVAPTTSSSAYVAPTTTSSAYVAPTTTSSAYVAPTTSSTSEYVASTTSSTAAAATSSSAAGTGSTYTGSLTYYAPGLGSCGITNTDSDYIVALAEDMMEADYSGNPNDNPLCNKEIAITWQGKTLNAKITDTCPGCSGAGLDLTPGLWAALDGIDVSDIADSIGVLKEATWSYV